MVTRCVKSRRRLIAQQVLLNAQQCTAVFGIFKDLECLNLSAFPGLDTHVEPKGSASDLTREHIMVLAHDKKLEEEWFTNERLVPLEDRPVLAIAEVALWQKVTGSGADISVSKVLRDYVGDKYTPTRECHRHPSQLGLDHLEIEDKEV